jgi:flagellin
MNNEYGQLSAEITRIAQTTTFNGISLLNTASTSTVSFHVGMGSIDLNPGQMDATTLGVSNTPGTKETWTHLTGVASADNQYINITAANVAVRFSIGNTSYGVTLGDDGTTTKSLNWLVGKINSAAGTNAPIAFASYDSTYNVYRLQLKGAGNGTGALNVFSATGATEIDATSDFGVAATITGSTGSGNSLETVSGATSALAALDTAIGLKDTYRAKLGYMMNRLQSAQGVLDIQAENLLAAKSRITDVDVATEMSALTRNQVLAQAGISMLAQAGKMPQMALTLLQG